MIHAPRTYSVFLVAMLAVVLTFSQVTFAAGHGGATGPIPNRITQAIDDSQTVQLARNTHPQATKENDRGQVSDSFYADHMLLVLQRSPAQERKLERFIDSLNDRKSPNFHHWMTPEQFGKYGVAQQDIDALVGWLESHGFAINRVYPNRMMIDFSGTAGSIREAFHTGIHQLEVNGEMHLSNMGDPQIPAALAPVITGVFSLNDFRPEPMYRSARDYTFAGCATSSSDPTAPGTCYAVTPQDNAVIYGLNPLWSGGISGQGQTIAVVEDTDTYGAATYADDWNTYRSTFGLSGFGGTYTQLHPNCTDPGTNADDGEAAIDVEVATATAPSAAIELLSCASGSFTFGGVLALTNLVNNSGPYPGVVSMSYGLCEAATGNGGNAYFYNAFQQAAAQGISAFASSGDGGPSGCSTIFNTSGPEYDITSLSITGWGESPYNVSVGGTDFEDTYFSKTGGAALSTYWNPTAPTAAPYGSALSYIPEIPWNDACASALISEVATGSFTPYGASPATCNNATFDTSTTYLSTGAGAGGASNCATGNGGASQTSAAVSDAYCQGYAKPSYQSGAALTGGAAVYGQPSDGVRDIPDVAMFAANGVWGHFETVCWSDPSYTADGAATCSGAPSTWSGFGGTSIASPTMAAIQALVNQKTGETWGNPNPIYYQIGQKQYGTAGGTFLGTSCNSSTGNTGGCAFNDVTQGDIDAACEDDGTTAESQCYKPTGTHGVASTDVISGTTIVTGGVGYTSNPTCIVAGPSNNNPYKSPTGTTLWAGGTQATCTATFNSGSTTAAYTIKFTASGSTINTDYPNQLAFTIGGVTYTMVSSLTGAPPNSVLLVASGSASTQETDNAKNLEAAINNTSSQCTTSPCFNVTAANPLATATESTSTVTITAKTAGYAGNFSVSLANVDAFFQVLEVVTLSQTAAGSGPGYVNAVTITNAGSGYGPQAPITFTGGAGSGAMALANTTPGTAASSYQPAYGAAPGWDMATGLGSPNANVLVNHCLWTGSCNAGTTTGVSSSTNPSNYGQSVSFTATVTGSSPTGSVQFQIDSANFGSAVMLSGGMATSGSTSTLSVGTHTVTAVYSGDSNNQGSTGTLSGGQVVNQASQAINFTTNAPASAAYASSFGVAATATSGLTVAFTSGGACSVVDNGNGSATYTMSAGSGSCSVIANQAGNGNYTAASQVTETTNATLASSGTTVQASPTTASPADTVTLTATVTGVTNGAAPTGTVTFFNGATQLGTCTLGSSCNASGPMKKNAIKQNTQRRFQAVTLKNGKQVMLPSAPSSTATLSVTNLPLGTDNITASYGADSNYSGGTSSPSAVNVIQPALYSPTPGSMLGSGATTFQWTAFPNATAYWVDIGSTAGGNNYYSSGSLGTAQSTTVSGFPTNGSTIYVTLYTFVSGSWMPNPYTYTAFNAGAESGTLTTPTPSTMLAGSTITFGWTAGSGSTAYWLDIGSTAGGNNYYSSGNLGTALSATAAGLPTNGSTVYVTLYSQVAGNWVPGAYTYTAYSLAAQEAMMSSPNPGSTLTSGNVTFTWTAGAGASAYWLDVGGTPGGNNYYSSGNLGSALTTTAYALPTDGSMIYATLYSLIGGEWYGNAYTYTALNATSGLAAMQSPAPGTTLHGTSATFTWSSDANATAYWVDIGSSAGGNNVYSSGNLATSLTTTVYSLPADGSTIYVSLYSYVGGQWINNPITYTSAP